MNGATAHPWGPIPALAAALLDTSVSLTALLRRGGPWGFIVDRRLRGAAEPAWWVRWWNWLRARVARKFPSLARALAEPHETVEQLCGDAHGWLARQNLEAAIPWFRSTGEAVPRGFAQVTDVGVVWAVVAWLSTRPGEAAFPPHDLLAEWTPAQPADCLALHLCVERILLAAARGEIDAGRTLGGLRRPEVLAAGLEFSRRAGWRRLQRLACASPLTLVVYADLFEAGNPEAEVARGAFQFADRAASPVEAGWRSSWHLLLARSLAGVVLSPPAIEERLEQAREALAALGGEPEKPVFFIFGRWAWNRWQDANGLVDLLAEERRRQCIARVRFLSELLAVAARDLGGVIDEETGEPLPADSRRAGASFVVARTWDMVVRTFFAREASNLMEGWRTAQGGDRMGEAARNELLSQRLASKTGGPPKPSITDNFFRQITCLEEWERRELRAEEWNATQCARLFELGVFADPVSRQRVLEYSGVGEGDMEHAMELLTDYRHAVLLPLDAADRRDRPPGLHLARWGEMLAAQLPEEVKVEVRTENVTEYV